ncbi:type I-E CRISPR-associated protein Cas6/Cse3/CasE [Anaerococcus murdochii]|uniref:type I-E CRISPR-associated protein Cas6/Cse3/CasE n=1 Tax=Anaerococcus murdochii TaxID=411577 RepID=UPI0032B52C84
MYLSRVEIDINNRRKMKDLTNLGCYHAWVEDSFPNSSSNENRPRKLWRIDNIYDKYYLLVLSENKPDIEKLEKYGLESSAEIKTYDGFLDSLEEGMRAKFKIKLNTVRAYKDEKNPTKRGRIMPVPNEKLNEFLIDKATRNGFEVKPGDFFISNIDKEYFMHTDKGETKKSRKDIVSATYEGILTITDLEKFKAALINGIGKKKAYGCGFLTIIPEK